MIAVSVARALSRQTLTSGHGFLLTVVLTIGAFGVQLEVVLVGADKSVTKPSIGRASLPTPIATAITLLGWPKDEIPNIEVVTMRPTDTSPTAEAWVWCNEDGSASPVIYVAADTDTYADALQESRQALVKLAGILAHERWHLHHGPDEVGAYEAQLGAMASLHADNVQLTGIRLALREVRRRGVKSSKVPAARAVGQHLAALPDFKDPLPNSGGKEHLAR
jgi:hypothetical protein